jgi:hypothetical protein
MIPGALVLGLGLAAAEPMAGNPQFLDLRVESVGLADRASGEAFVRRSGGRESESDGSLPTIKYANPATGELLALVMHPGGLRFQFMEYRIRRMHPGEAAGTRVVGGESFRTGRGVHLGLTAEELVRTLGAPHKQTRKGHRRVLRYGCTSSATCPILKEVNMPEYSATYVFQDGVLVDVEAGYPYP